MISNANKILLMITMIGIFGALSFYLGISELKFHIEPTNLISQLYSPVAENQTSTLIVFAYAQGEHRDANLEFFIKNGGIINTPNYHYVFIGSGVEWKKTKYHDMMRKFPNTEMVERENTGFDSCAWKQVLESKGLNYQRFVLLNGSIRGPFLPVYASHVHWPEIFLEPFQGGNPRRYGLSGLTVSCWPSVHIQSMLLAFTRDSYDTLLSTLGCFKDKDTTIYKGEIMYSQTMLHSNFNLYSLMKFWQHHDFRKEETTKAKCLEIPTDTFYANSYFGMSHHPFELIFLKTNRDLPAKQMENYSKWEANAQ
jgi:hypothetical protein